MRALPVVLTSIAVFSLSGPPSAQESPRTLLVVAAHADDESPVGSMLARYAREGVRMYLLIVTDGAQGGAHTSIPRGPELARAGAEEARCAAEALGLQPPIILDFPDVKLGDYGADPSLLFRVTARIAQEMARLRPDAIVTWGPDGGMGHPDHRIVSDLMTQLVRAGAPGSTERLYYMNIPVEGFRAMYPERPAPQFMVPEARHFTVHVSFEPEDAEAERRAMVCHRTQYSDDMVQRVMDAMVPVLNGSMPLIPAFEAVPKTDQFR